jgi:heme-degrading monooxygenase HmoA
MIEIIATYDFFPGVDQAAWAELATRGMGPLLKAPGFVELRANRNMQGSPHVRTTYVFQSLGDWANYAESPDYRALEPEARNFMTNIEANIWGPSPVVPEPVRSGANEAAKIEVAQNHNLLPNIDQDAYGDLSGRAMGLLLAAPGFVEFRGNRNLLGSPQVLATSTWTTLTDYARLLESPEWRALEVELRGFISNINVTVWGPSPIVPEPVRP